MLYRKIRLYGIQGLQSVRICFSNKKGCKLLLLMTDSKKLWVQVSFTLKNPSLAFFADGCLKDWFLEPAKDVDPLKQKHTVKIRIENFASFCLIVAYTRIAKPLFVL